MKTTVPLNKRFKLQTTLPPKLLITFHLLLGLDADKTYLFI